MSTERENSGRTPERGAARVVDLADLTRSEDANEFQGHYLGAGVSFIVM